MTPEKLSWYKKKIERGEHISPVQVGMLIVAYEDLRETVRKLKKDGGKAEELYEREIETLRERIKILENPPCDSGCHGCEKCRRGEFYR